ncbi:MAG: 16S rRNA (adenine(1518)-N(6)/adenine(1519)-N(6))-dimethyltransferase RsmA [Clostridia bacterium]|nr:16S rRNA (adenine(1518)-N(6)/adenine(1519)-N(6))-dimethyltransferase RsmA [Clostridia bacterium]
MILNQYHLKANKRYGQNFLINQNIVDEIIEKSEINENDVVIEIGPGLGTLTKALATVAKKVIAVELDENMVKILKERPLGNNIEIIHDDILKVDLKSIIDTNESVKVVANLPYYITTPIIMTLLENKYNLQSITVMVQKEVGRRICSEPGSKEYGAITVSVKYYSDAKIIIDVPKDNFLPAPEVDSCVIKLDIRKTPIVELNDEKLFFEIIKNGFCQRRKTILNSLTSNGITKEKLKDILDKLELSEKLRAEDLSIYDFANISNMVGGKND